MESAAVSLPGDAAKIKPWLEGQEISATDLTLCNGDLHIQFWGWELVLCDDGGWFFNDTSGG